MQSVQCTYLSDELVCDCLGADLVGCQCPLEEETEREFGLNLRQSIDGLKTKLEDSLTLLHPTVILKGREREGRREEREKERERERWGWGRIRKE